MFLENLPTPTSSSEPATKEYVDGIDDMGWVNCGTQTFSLTKDSPSGSKAYNNIPDNFSKIKFIVDADLSNFRNSSDVASLFIQGNLFFESARNSNYTGKFHIERIINYSKVFYYDTSLVAFHTAPVVQLIDSMGSYAHVTDSTIKNDKLIISSITANYYNSTATIKLTIYAK